LLEYEYANLSRDCGNAVLKKFCKLKNFVKKVPEFKYFKSEE